MDANPVDGNEQVSVRGDADDVERGTDREQWTTEVDAGEDDTESLFAVSRQRLPKTTAKHSTSPLSLCTRRRTLCSSYAMMISSTAPQRR